ncbi:hypothetical protein [Capnocytophaga bilenii]
MDYFFVGLSQLADFPSVRAALAFILRSTFAQPSLNLRSRFALNRFIENVGVIAN